MPQQMHIEGQLITVGDNETPQQALARTQGEIPQFQGPGQPQQPSLSSAGSPQPTETNSPSPRPTQSGGGPPSTPASNPPGTAPNAPNYGNAGEPRPGGMITVRMPDGTTQTFTGEYWKDPKLDAALKGNGIPLDPIDGTPMKVDSGVHGGYLFNGLPINTIGTGQFLPGQEQALNDYYSAGYKPGGGRLQNEPALRPNDAQYGGNGPFDFGYLAQPFNEQFKGPEGGPPKPFEFDPNKAMNDPSYQFALNEGMKAMQRAQSAGMRLSSGRALKEADRYGTDYATTKINDVFGRDLSSHQAATNDYNNQWQQGMQEFMNRYNIDTGNKTNIFNRYSSLAGMGQVSANQLSQAGTSFGNQAGVNIGAGANATASGIVGAGNANANGVGGVARSIYALPQYNQYGRTTSLGDAR